MECDKELTTTKATFNSQKERMCRLFVLAPLACVVFVCLVLLISMKIVPDMQKTDSKAENCVIVWCKVIKARINSKYQIKCSTTDNYSVVHNNSDEWMENIELPSNTKMPLNARTSTNKSTEIKAGSPRCLKDIPQYINEITASAMKTGLTLDELLGGTCPVCLYHKSSTMTEFIFQATGKSLRNYFKRFDKEEMDFRCVINPEGMNTKPHACSTVTDKQRNRNMKKNTKVVVLVLAILLPLSLLGLLLLCIFTSKAMKACCHLCYDVEEA